jgi:hypothetical protein
VRPATPALLLTGVLACGSIPSDANGVISLEVRAPLAPVVEPNDTIQLSAVARNINGDSVGVQIIWRTPDDTTISVDSLGKVTGDSLIGVPRTRSGRVQAVVGSIVSPLVVFKVILAEDTLAILGDDSIRVASSDTLSPALMARIRSFTPDSSEGVAGRSITFEVDSVFPDADTANVRLSPGIKRLITTATGASGAPTDSVHVVLVNSTPRPDSVLVKIGATRPSGTPVPGSWLLVPLPSLGRFVVRFDP